MRPIFCGNLEFDARQSDIERLFRRYGRVERVDLKSGKVASYLLDFFFFFLLLPRMKQSLLFNATLELTSWNTSQMRKTG